MALEREPIYQTIFEEALVGLAQTSLDGRFLLVNRRLRELLGYTAAELSSIDFMAVSHPDEVAQDMDARARLLAGVIDRHVRDKRYRRKDGAFVWTALSVRLHRHDTGEPHYFIAVVEDITERKRAEEESRQLHKMEAVGRLAGGIAHDFNNLLTAIAGYADLALYQLEPEDPVARDVRAIRAGAISAASLPRQLLAFSRKQMLQPQVLDLNVVVSRMRGLLQRLIGEHIQLQWKPQDGIDRVTADAGQIEQVILNLALNARDAMPGGGTLSIETAHLGRDVMLAISDTGVGMDDTVQAHLFEPFFTTKEIGKGTGLGLATVYGIITQSGGSIVVTSQPDSGTTFRILLPRTDHIAGDLHGDEAAPRPPGGSETILLVEDQLEVRSVISAALTRHGYSVLEASHGEEALHVVRDHPGAIHLLLTDVVMPVMGGPELARRLFQQRPHVRVLYTSGYADAAMVQGTVDAGLALIQKPFSPESLLYKVREVLDAPADPGRL